QTASRSHGRHLFRPTHWLPVGSFGCHGHLLPLPRAPPLSGMGGGRSLSDVLVQGASMLRGFARNRLEVSFGGRGHDQGSFGRRENRPKPYGQGQIGSQAQPFGGRSGSAIGSGD